MTITETPAGYEEAILWLTEDNRVALTHPDPNLPTLVYNEEQMTWTPLNKA